MADHVLKSIKPNSKGFDEEEAVGLCLNFVRTDIALSNCRRQRGVSNTFTQCTCMRFLAEEDAEHTATAVAEYMVRFAGMTLKTKREVVLEWIKVSAMLESSDPSNKLTYMLPGLPPSEDGEQTILICRNDIANLLNIGRRLWQTAKSVNCSKPDGKTGRKGLESNKGKHYTEIYASLNNFFKELEQDGLQFATRIIREETGMTTRDDDLDELVLPPHVSKHSCYGRWCYSRGWKPTKLSAAKTIYRPTAEYERRPHDDDSEVPLWPTGSEYQPVVTWPSFLAYWKTNFSHLKIRKKGADTCTDCQVLCNEFRMRSSVAKRRRLQRDQEQGRAEGDELSDDDEDVGRAEGDKSSDDEDGESTETEVGGQTTKSEEDDVNLSVPSEAEMEAEIERIDAAIVKAKEHVRQYTVQRCKCKHLIALSQLDISNHLPSLFRQKVLTIDMGQNLCLPNFEAEQPGDTYYFSPLTILLFGVVDNATEDGKDRMNAYIWREFDGARGANNIASCLLKDLKLRGCFDRPNFSELTYVADNCGGQNKNRTVIRFLMWLVENRIFPQVKILFLVKGHTKNAADRMFNLLKLSYHKQNIFSYDKMEEVLNKNQFVDVHKMKPEEFFDHEKWQNLHYRKPTGGEFKQTHVFTIKRGGGRNGGPTVLMKQDDNDAAIRLDDLKPTRKSRTARRLNPEQRTEAIAKMEQNLEQLVPPPLRAIKQVELYSKWRPLIPEKYRDITCPKPSDEIIESIKSEKREKVKKRTAAKSTENASNPRNKKQKAS